MSKKILALPTTYIDRSNTNDFIRMEINKRLRAATQKPLIALTEYHKRARIKSLQKLIVTGSDDPGTMVTFDHVTLKQIDHGKKRVGQPRKNWYKATVADLWIETKKSIETVKFASELDLDNPIHVHALFTISRQKIK